MGPIFFLLYINDLNTAVNSNPRFFADNTCLEVRVLDIPKDYLKKKLIKQTSRVVLRKY